MDKDYIKEMISNYKDMRRDFWTTVVVLAGGMIGIVFSMNNFVLNIYTVIKAILFIMGISLIILLVNGIAACNKEIYNLFEKLKMGDS